MDDKFKENREEYKNLELDFYKKMCTEKGKEIITKTMFSNRMELTKEQVKEIFGELPLPPGNVVELENPLRKAPIKPDKETPLPMMFLIGFITGILFMIVTFEAMRWT